MEYEIIKLNKYLPFEIRKNELKDSIDKFFKGYMCSSIDVDKGVESAYEFIQDYLTKENYYKKDVPISIQVPIQVSHLYKHLWLETVLDKNNNIYGTKYYYYISYKNSLDFDVVPVYLSDMVNHNKFVIYYKDKIVELKIMNYIDESD